MRMTIYTTRRHRHTLFTLSLYMIRLGCHNEFELEFFCPTVHVSYPIFHSKPSNELIAALKDCKNNAQELEQWVCFANGSSAFSSNFPKNHVYHKSPCVQNKMCSNAHSQNRTFAGRRQHADDGTKNHFLRYIFHQSVYIIHEHFEHVFVVNNTHKHDAKKCVSSTDTRLGEWRWWQWCLLCCLFVVGFRWKMLLVHVLCASVLSAKRRKFLWLQMKIRRQSTK